MLNIALTAWESVLKMLEINFNPSSPWISAFSTLCTPLVLLALPMADFIRSGAIECLVYQIISEMCICMSFLFFFKDSCRGWKSFVKMHLHPCVSLEMITKLPSAGYGSGEAKS